MLLMFEKSIQGQFFKAVKCYAKVNEMYMKNQYKLDDRGTYLQYLDPNKLYGG